MVTGKYCEMLFLLQLSKNSSYSTCESIDGSKIWCHEKNTEMLLATVGRKFMWPKLELRLPELWGTRDKEFFQV